MILNFLIFVLTIVCVIYFYIRKKYSYWSDRNVPYDKPIFPYGFLKDVGTKYQSSQIIKQIYDRMKHYKPFIGVYSFIEPMVIVTDLELLKRMCISDFQYFVNRGLYYNKKDDPLTAHLVHIEDQEWKDLRAKLTSTFTSGKMKMMLPTILDVANEFKKCIENEIKLNPEIEMKNIIARFTTDIIGTVAFGLECNSLKNPNAEFREMGRKVFASPRHKIVTIFLMARFKQVARFLGMKIVRDDVSRFFLDAVKQTMEYRKKTNTQKNDFMNLLMQLHVDSCDDKSLGLTFEEIAAQAFVFFLGGFETSSTAMSFTLYELALHQDIQDKARNEINEVLSKHNNQLTYEAIGEMHYIEQIINESLRKYPPVPSTARVASMDYKVPDTNFIIKKGIPVFFPIYSIHHDSNYYPNPEEFNPERFSNEEIKKRHPYSFIPFGEGPRICIGMRFGVLQTKIGIITLLRSFKFTPHKTTEVPLKFRPTTFVLSPKGGLWFNVEKLNK